MALVRQWEIGAVKRALEELGQQEWVILKKVNLNYSIRLKSHEISHSRIAKFFIHFIIPFDYFSTELVFTVVTKRINTRFFEKHGTSYRNPFQGTVVSDKITKSDQAFDFYLVSQSVSQGTVSPTHYTVLEWPTETILTPEHLQRISFRLCHMYFNWTVSSKNNKYIYKIVKLCNLDNFTSQFTIV